jgi:A/G-specific adenine glycosylase
VTHVFTHFRLELAVVTTTGAASEGWWQPLDELAEAGLPTLYRRAAEGVLQSRSKLAA